MTKNAKVCQTHEKTSKHVEIYLFLVLKHFFMLYYKSSFTLILHYSVNVNKNLHYYDKKYKSLSNTSKNLKTCRNKCICSFETFFHVVL